MQIESVFAAIGSCIMAVVNAIAAVLKAIINVRIRKAQRASKSSG